MRFCKDEIKAFEDDVKDLDRVQRFKRLDGVDVTLNALEATPLQCDIRYLSILNELFSALKVL